MTQSKLTIFRLSVVLFKYSSSVEYTQRLLSEYLNNVTLFTRVPGLQVFNNVLMVKTIILKSHYFGAITWYDASN